MKPMWYLYVLQCNDRSYYTGITVDIQRRLTQHQAGTGSRYTRAHLPVQLIAAWSFSDRSTASRAEARFKKLRRATKTAYIRSQKPFMEAPFVLGNEEIE